MCEACEQVADALVQGLKNKKPVELDPDRPIGRAEMSGPNDDGMFTITLDATTLMWIMNGLTVAHVKLNNDNVSMALAILDEAFEKGAVEHGVNSFDYYALIKETADNEVKRSTDYAMGKLVKALKLSDEEKDLLDKDLGLDNEN